MYRHYQKIILLFALTAAVLSGCGGAANTAAPTHTQRMPLVVNGSPATATLRPSATALPSATATKTPEPSPTATASPSPTPETAVVLAAGDIGVCGVDKDDRTAALLGDNPGEILAVGDIAYETGEMWTYTRCFGESWGLYKDRTHPVPGNHDYNVPGAANYFEYFGEAAGEPGKGYYSFDAGEWHIIALNSQCTEIGGCGPDAPQAQWLKADLEASDAACTLAYFHHPRWSSGLAGSIYWMDALWQQLYAHGAEIAIGGHDHDYERFAPQDPAGNADPERGIRQFVVGTGGAYNRVFNTILPNSEAHATDVWGVLKLTLRPDGYDWAFLPAEGTSFIDSGSGTCHP